MKKYLALFCCLITGCSCICPTEPVRVISNEKDTKIYYNGEYIGTDSTFAILRNKNIDKSYLAGEKKGCAAKIIQPDYSFDLSTLWILDLRNLVRLLSWDVYKIDDSRNLYNVTPKCGQ